MLCSQSLNLTSSGVLLNRIVMIRRIIMSIYRPQVAKHKNYNMVLKSVHLCLKHFAAHMLMTTPGVCEDYSCTCGQPAEAEHPTLPWCRWCLHPTALLHLHLPTQAQWYSEDYVFWFVQRIQRHFQKSLDSCHSSFHRGEEVDFASDYRHIFVFLCSVTSYNKASRKSRADCLFWGGSGLSVSEASCCLWWAVSTSVLR